MAKNQQKAQTEAAPMETATARFIAGPEPDGRIEGVPYYFADVPPATLAALANSTTDETQNFRTDAEIDEPKAIGDLVASIKTDGWQEGRDGFPLLHAVKGYLVSAFRGNRRGRALGNLSAEELVKALAETSRPGLVRVMIVHDVPAMKALDLRLDQSKRGAQAKFTRWGKVMAACQYRAAAERAGVKLSRAHVAFKIGEADSLDDAKAKGAGQYYGYAADLVTLYPNSLGERVKAFCDQERLPSTDSGKTERLKWSDLGKLTKAAEADRSAGILPPDYGQNVKDVLEKVDGAAPDVKHSISAQGARDLLTKADVNPLVAHAALIVTNGHAGDTPEAKAAARANSVATLDDARQAQEERNTLIVALGHDKYDALLADCRRIIADTEAKAKADTEAKAKAKAKA